MPIAPHIVVTGGNGYIGSRLVSLLRARGVCVTTLGRGDGGWALDRPVPPGILDGADAVIHLAHQWVGAGPIETDVNVSGTRALLEASRRAGVRRFVFGSSVAARPGALNRYGRIKHAIEKMLSGPGEIAARIGMVYGGRSASQWGTLVRLSRLPVLPMLEPGKAVQPIHLDDLCEGLIRLAMRPTLARTIYGLCDARTTTLGDILRTIARIKHDSTLRILPIPARFALALVDGAARVPGLPRVDRERILGIMGLPTIDSAADLRELELTLRPLEAGLAPDVRERRRRLLVEGRALLAAVLGEAPPKGLVRRYARAIERHEGGAAIHLPALAARAPIVLSLCEPVGRADSPLARRLSLAVRIVAASPVGAARCHPAGESGPVAVILRLAIIAAREAMLFPVRLVFGRGR